ncbi:hypothetical protein L1887_48826 [Cichorium endivia]|nr:hypothetical protein L1887_48826 [Cichorium endivia]
MATPSTSSCLGSGRRWRVHLPATQAHRLRLPGRLGRTDVQRCRWVDAGQRLAHRHAPGQAQQRLGPEYLSQRPGPGGVKRLTYIEGWKLIDLANEVFGFNGWSTTIRKLEIDFLDSPDGTRWSAGVTCILRVTLRDGAFHEDVGYGSADNCAPETRSDREVQKGGGHRCDQTSTQELWQAPGQLPL